MSDARSEQPQIWLSEGQPTRVPDIAGETRRAVIDIIRGDPPASTLGVLMEAAQPLTIEQIAARLDLPAREVDWTVALLEEQELAGRIIDHEGYTRFFAFAPYTDQYPESMRDGMSS